MVPLASNIFSGWHHARRHRGRRRTLAKSMPSKMSVKSLHRISIPAGEVDPSSRTVLAAFGTSKVPASKRLILA